jgi:UDP-N-acetylbacillosamine N-acetyltransferase
MHTGIHIYGTGGHALSVFDVLQSIKFKGEIIFLDKNRAQNDFFLGRKIYQEIQHEQFPIHIAIGNNQVRKEIYYKLSNFYSVISDKSYISEIAELGKNIFIGNFVHIGPKVNIGDNCIINTAVVLEHEVTIGRHCHIAISANIAGKTRLGDEVFVGAHATIINNITICSNVTIGAGATVVEDIKEPGVYIGVPAKKVTI